MEVDWETVLWDPESPVLTVQGQGLEACWECSLWPGVDQLTSRPLSSNISFTDTLALNPYRGMGRRHHGSGKKVNNMELKCSKSIPLLSLQLFLQFTKIFNILVHTSWPEVPTSLNHALSLNSSPLSRSPLREFFFGSVFLRSAHLETQTFMAFICGYIKPMCPSLFVLLTWVQALFPWVVKVVRVWGQL